MIEYEDKTVVRQHALHYYMMCEYREVQNTAITAGETVNGFDFRMEISELGIIKIADPQLQAQSGYWSENQDRALVVSLQMFNLILERCISLLEDHLSKNNNQISQLSQDIIILLPAIKVWCDWMLCHSSVWNPPPSTQDFKVG
ncbi:unnamed protein product [Brassicogethes aeneus]|uniref:DNA/RNA-binding domain-containing protein n=1 Tax=Brassicogethes aeneus TaxID=1431903 RepID=A0A9P0FIC0_BRAAE|nr:unnamed protein product [Brassicogethes aeneus]